MIGNLLLALGLAFCCGCGLTDEPQYTSMNDYVTSHVTGQSIYCYSFFDFGYAGNLSYTETYDIGTGNYNNDYQALVNNPPYIFQLDYSYQFAYDYQSDDSIRFYWYNEDLNGLLLRIYVPLSSSVSALEFNFYTQNNVAWSGIGFGDVTDYNLNYIGSNSADAWYLMQSMYSISSTNSFSSGSFSLTTSKFSEYFFYFRKVSGSNPNIVAKIYLCNAVNLQYDEGYAIGYQNGYRQGSGDGYANGYAEGLAVGTGGNAQIRNLFGVIADTPIRYLRQMFNFELFGMNVAVVILSCLTAIIIFSIIKKVWK